ncbi:cytochrome P450 4C1-like isoform X2 [Argiope bruennichi]|nr:cytochrome P450 4C1-like isoform X2 [Argiope bruennichi]
MILWWNEWLFILKIALSCLVILIIYKILHYIRDGVRKYLMVQSSSVPALKGIHSLRYLSIIISTYKQSTPNCPPLALILQWLWALCLLYGTKGVMRGTLLFKQGILFYKPETVQVLLSDKDLIEKSSEYKLMVPWLGTGLITSGGAKWRKHRKLLTPNFHFSLLEKSISVFQQQSEILVSKLELRVEESWIDALPLIRACTLDALCESAMGISINAQNYENVEYGKAIQEVESSIMLRLLQPWLYPDIIFNLTSRGKTFKTNLQIIHGLNEKVLKEKKIEMIARADWKSKSEIETEGSCFNKKKPFLEFLLEYHLKNPLFTETDVRDEVDTFMSAGHDTTAVTMNWVLYCLGVYQDIQKKVYEEIEETFEREENNISCEALTRMKYLECVIKETMRLYPTVPFILRENKKPFKVLGYTVYPGTICAIFIFALHRDPESFPNPEIFDPDRFLPENNKKRHPYSYVPFSAGFRNCIGQKFAMMEMKIILSSILRNFRVISLDNRDKVIICPSLVIQTAKPLRLKFVSR